MKKINLKGIYFTLLNLVLCVCCTNCTHSVKKSEDSGIRDIEIMANLFNHRKINLSTVASNIEYCWLETDEKCLVTPTAMSVYCSKDYVVTIGCQSPDRPVCYVFNRKTGNFVRQISSMGQGPDEYYVYILKIFEDNRHLYFTVEYRQQLYPAMYDKTESQLQVLTPLSIPPMKGKDWKIPLYGFENDLDNGLPFWPQQMISGKEMMCVYTAEELLALDRSKITNAKLKNILENLEEDSNPVVAIVTLKN